MFSLYWMPEFVEPRFKWVEVTVAQAPIIAAKSLVKVSSGLKAGPGLAWDARAPYTCLHPCHSTTAQVQTIYRPFVRNNSLDLYQQRLCPSIQHSFDFCTWRMCPNISHSLDLYKWRLRPIILHSFDLQKWRQWQIILPTLGLCYQRLCLIILHYLVLYRLMLCHIIKYSLDFCYQRLCPFSCILAASVTKGSFQSSSILLVSDRGIQGQLAKPSHVIRNNL
jgi:hypothetical protein